jgi:diguanylate cyclase (GGDEF)-like protein
MSDRTPLVIETRDVVINSIDAAPPSIPVSVAMTDLDGFAVLNDTHGRDAGDAVLTGFGQALAQNLPDEVGIHRIGGDEWAIVFFGLPLENSLVLLEELRAHVAAAPLGTADHPITMSAGIAARPPHGTNGSQLLRAADEALSQSKRAGRNKVGIYVEDKMVMKSNYYPRATLDRLTALSRATNRTEASLLREAADTLLERYAAET